ncbi:unnamed protein product [Closterium sp. NIES-54]
MSPGTDCYTWEGVICDSRSGAVASLFLISAGIKGTIPPAIGNLTALTSLIFLSNTLKGRLPRSVGLLSRLQELMTGDNGPGMSENIPTTLSRLTNLVRLDLSGNRFSGPILRFILDGTMKKLEELGLSRNRLTGSIPGEKIGALLVLNSFNVGDKGLTGSIPMEIGKLRALKYLLVQNNQLEGALPSSLMACTGLEILAIGTNRLGGPLPVNILPQLPKLKVLSLKRNRFIVTLLEPLANHPKLRDIDMSLNKVARPILATLGRLKTSRT